MFTQQCTTKLNIDDNGRVACDASVLLEQELGTEPAIAADGSWTALEM